VTYQIVAAPAAQRDLKRLPAQVRRAVVDIHLPQIAATPRSVGEPLHGDLKGFWSYHFGHRPEYRILYTIDAVAEVISVIFVGTRENAYGEARRRLA
jgi:addiction module RelE/StbE family toxin